MPGIIPVVLLTISNIFMTFAWYGHLRFKSSPIWEAILFSWLIASLEYCFQVPANRLGSYHFTTAQLKIIQEVITLVVFSIFSVLYLKEQLRWNYLVAFVFLMAAVCLVFINFKDPVIAHKISNSNASIEETLLGRVKTNENTSKQYLGRTDSA